MQTSSRLSRDWQAVRYSRIRFSNASLRSFPESYRATPFMVRGGDQDHGAFLAIHMDRAMEIPARLQREGIICDARGEWLRLCPDCLARDDELRCAAATLSRLLRAQH